MRLLIRQIENNTEMKKEENKIRSITCKEAEKSFNDLIDGYFKGKMKTELEHHIAHCRHCFGRIEFEQKLKERIHESALAINSKSLVRKISTLLDND